jgi:hypothetical protein
MRRNVHRVGWHAVALAWFCRILVPHSYGHGGWPIKRADYRGPNALSTKARSAPMLSPSAQIN